MESGSGWVDGSRPAASRVRLRFGISYPLYWIVCGRLGTRTSSGEWWHTLTMGQQEAHNVESSCWRNKDPALRRPVVGAVRGSRHQNMKELHTSAGGGSSPVLLAFDPRRQVVFLLTEWE